MLEPLVASGFRFSEPIQEDYGWGLWADKDKDPFWIALSYCGSGPTEEPAEWVVTVAYDPGLNIVKRLFHRPSGSSFAALRDQVWSALRSNPDIEVSEFGERAAQQRDAADGPRSR
jgi:hypothetical protein